MEDKWYSYKSIPIDLSLGLNEYPVDVTGERILFNSGTQDLKIKLDHQFNDNISLSPNESLIASFSKLYLSCDPKNETIELIVSLPASIYKESNVVNVNNSILEPATQYNNKIITCTLALTTYTDNFWYGTKSFSLRARGGTIYWGGTNFDVPNGIYNSLNADEYIFINNLNFISYNELNIQSPTAGTILELSFYY